MKYEKPEITLSANAAEVIQGPKIGGPSDFTHPQDPIHSTGTYQSDE